MSVKEPVDAIAKLHVRYKRGDSQVTDRVVSVTEFDSETFSGLCHLRRSHRTFYFSRIRTCCNVVSGEVITDAYGFLCEAYGRSVWHSLDRICSNNMPILTILLYVARVDGQMRAPERKVITAAAKVFTHDTRISDEQVKWLLTRLEPYSLPCFKAAVGRINKLGDPAINRKLVAAARTIIATQKTASPGEQEALDYMMLKLVGPV